ncbi:MAG: hypothetical protein ACFFD8_06935, partial [Candidatus Thorarchaeota archaeon]
QSKKNAQRRVTVHVDTPEDLPEAISWLRKLLGTAYSLNLEGIIRLKSQFDQIYDDHVTEFDKKLRKINYESTEMLKEFMTAKAILGHLLAVCKYLERIVDVQKMKENDSSQAHGSTAISRILKKDLTRELRIFSQHLQQKQDLSMPKF